MLYIDAVARDKAKMQSEWKAKWEAARQSEEWLPLFTSLPLKTQCDTSYHVNGMLSFGQGLHATFEVDST